MGAPLVQVEPSPDDATPAGRTQSVTLHTNLGDIKIEIFCEQVPRTAENFLALAANGYYDSTVFHRNIKSFMIQGGTWVRGA